MVIELERELEGPLKAEAARLGVEPSEVVARVLREKWPVNRNEAARMLLRELRESGVPSDPDEAARRQAELDAWKAQMNANRAGERPLFPEVLPPDE